MENQKNILDYDTVALDEAQDAVIIIDQTLLPGKIELIALHTAQEMWDAIYLLKVRGAPAIGVAAALGIYLLANRIETEDFEEFYQKFTEYKEYLDSSRPTAVNLSWALKRMDAVAVKAGREEHKTVAKVKEILHDEALQIRAEDVEVCRKIGEFGLELVKPGDKIQITEYQSYMNYSYIIEPAVAMSGCYPNSQRIKAKEGTIVSVEKAPLSGYVVIAEFEE